MNKIFPLLLIIVIAVPIRLAAFERNPVQDNPTDPKMAAAKARNEAMRVRLNLPVRLPLDRDHQRSDGGKKRYPPSRVWPAQTTVVKEVQPIIIVNPPPPEKPPVQPDVEYVWVPAVTETRTEPGHWDDGIKKEWMGDHWRYTQDFSEKTWVPETQVQVVKQAGYWNIIR